MLADFHSVSSTLIVLLMVILVTSALSYPSQMRVAGKAVWSRARTIQCDAGGDSDMVGLETRSVPKRHGYFNANQAIKIGAIALSGIMIPLLTVQAAPDLTSSASTEAPIVVLGGGGKTGKLIVQLLAKRGRRVVSAVRDLSKVASGNNSQDPISVQVDVTRLETIGPAIIGASVVIFAASASRKGGSAKQVDFTGVENVAKECVRLKIPRLVVISSGAITKPDSLGYKVTNLFGGIMGYKLLGEDSLKRAYSSAVDDVGYAIIRPGGLLDRDVAVGAGLVELNQGDTISGEISRIDVAECAVAAALSKSIPSKVTFEVYEADKSGPLQSDFPKVSGFERSGRLLGADYEVLFRGLKQDS